MLRTPDPDDARRNTVDLTHLGRTERRPYSPSSTKSKTPSPAPSRTSPARRSATPFTACSRAEATDRH